MDVGNKSIGEGELSKKFKIIHKIIDGKNAHDIERTTMKESEQAEKNLIQDTSNRIVSQRTVKRDVGKVVYHLDGTVSDNRIPKKAGRFEDYLFKKLSPDNDIPCNEIATEEMMLTWIASNGFTADHLFTDVNIELLPRFLLV